MRTPYEEPEPQRGPGPSVPQAGRPRGPASARRRSPSRVGERSVRSFSASSISLRIRSPTEDAFSRPMRRLRMRAHLLADGADILDLGAASSNPDAKPVAPEIEIARLAPVVARAEGEGVRLSIDSFSLQVQRWALARTRIS